MYLNPAMATSNERRRLRASLRGVSFPQASGKRECPKVDGPSVRCWRSVRSCWSIGRQQKDSLKSRRVGGILAAQRHNGVCSYKGPVFSKAKALSHDNRVGYSYGGGV